MQSEISLILCLIFPRLTRKQIREAKGDMTQQQQEDEFSTYKE